MSFEATQQARAKRMGLRLENYTVSLPSFPDITGWRIFRDATTIEILFGQSIADFPNILWLVTWLDGYEVAWNHQQETRT